jgi:hypothetical protein
LAKQVEHPGLQPIFVSDLDCKSTPTGARDLQRKNKPGGVLSAQLRTASVRGIGYGIGRCKRSVTGVPAGGSDIGQQLVTRAIVFWGSLEPLRLFVWSITLLTALILKFVPDAATRWRDVWFGVAVTSLLFTLRKTAMGWYFGYSLLISAYGSAAFLAIFLVWIDYSA